MTRKRTTVFADEDDLAILKQAAARQGIAEAELLRDAIHLAAMANRTWTEPFFTRTFAAGDDSPSLGDAREHVWSEKAEAYERTKRTTL